MMIWSLWASAAMAQNVGVGGGAGCTYLTLADALAATWAPLYIKAGEVLYEGGLTIDVDVSTGTLNCGLGTGGEAPAAIDGSNVLGPLSVPAGATVTMRNLIVRSHTGSDGGNLWVGGALVLDDVDVIGGDADWGGGIFVEDGGYLETLGDTLISLNSASYGGGIRIEPTATAVLTEDTVLSLNSGLTGGGIASSGSLDLQDDVSLQANDAANFGGGIYSAQSLSVVCSGCRVVNNTAASHGGGIYLSSSSSSQLSGLWIEGNVAGGQGGGIHAGSFNGSLFGEMLTVRGNVAGDAGGGIWARDLTLLDSLIEDNEAGTDGGGIHASGSFLDLWSSEVHHNDAAGNGAGAYVDWIEDAEIAGTQIHHNHAGGDGGGLYVFLSDVSAVGSWFNHNDAVGLGGGIRLAGYSFAPPSLSLDGPRDIEGCETGVVTTPGFDRYCSEVRANTADRGAGLSVEVGNVLVRRTAFVANDAVTDGHAIELESLLAPTMTMVNTLVSLHPGLTGEHTVRVGDGATLDAKYSTFAQNTGTPVSYAATATGPFWRNIVWGGDAFEIEPGNTIDVSCSSFDAVSGAYAGASYALATDPLFATTARGRFRLSAASPAIDQCITGPAGDLDDDPRPVAPAGTPRPWDRGAFERQ